MQDKYASQKKYAEKLKERTTRISVRYYDGVDDDILDFMYAYEGNTNQFIKDAIREKMNRTPRGDVLQAMDSKFYKILQSKLLVVRSVSTLDGRSAYKEGDFIDGENLRSSYLFRIANVIDYEYYIGINQDESQVIFQVLGDKPNPSKKYKNIAEAVDDQEAIYKIKKNSKLYHKAMKEFSDKRDEEFLKRESIWSFLTEEDEEEN